MADFSFHAERAKTYAEGPPRQVPGYDSLHKMIAQIFQETLREDGRLLIAGAGGGLEIKALAEMQPGWLFEGFDPSADMIDLARQMVRPHLDRVDLRAGYIDVASQDIFDAATAMLVFHFVSRSDRIATLRKIHARLKPDAPFAMVHLSFPQSEPERTQWLKRHILFSQKEMDEDRINRSLQAMKDNLTILDPAEDEALLREAGFCRVSLFYTGLALRGWIAYA